LQGAFVGQSKISRATGGIIGGGITSDLNFKSLSRGFPRQANSSTQGVIPRFADPLKEAIFREKAAGVPANQIYVDTDPRVKGPGNPLGLLVANKRDEPLGGFQGVNRAIREGANPKNYGAKSGVPNFAAFDRIKDSSLKDSLGVLLNPSEIDAVNKAISDYGDALKANSDELRKQAKEIALSLPLDKESNNLVKLALEQEGKSYELARKENARIEKDLQRARAIASVKINRGATSISGPQTTSAQFPLTPTQQALVNQSNTLQAKMSNKAQFSPVSFRETGLKKQLTGLSDNQLFELLNKSGLQEGQSKLEDVNSLRKILSSGSVNKDKSVNRDVIEQTIGLARSGTLATDFEETVKKLVKRGNTLEDAYETASDELLNSGGNSRQLAKVQLNYAQTLTKFEKDIEKQRELTVKEGNIASSGIKIRTAINRTNQALATSQGDLSKLTRQQQAILFSGLRAEAKQSLGFGGFSRGQLAGNADANKQIEDFVGRRLSEIQSSLRNAAKEAARTASFGTQAQRLQEVSNKLGGGLGVFGSIFGSEARDRKKIGNVLADDEEAVGELLKARGEKRFQRRNNLALGAAFALPFAAGSLPEGRGGTLGGAGLGAASGALQGAGVGGLFGAPGLVVGAAVGGLVGVFNKLEKSTQEIAEDFNKLSDNIQKTEEATRVYLDSQEKLSSAIASGSGQAIIKALSSRSAIASRDLQISAPQLFKDLAEAGTDNEKQQVALLKQAELDRKKTNAEASRIAISRTKEFGTLTKQFFVRPLEGIAGGTAEAEKRAASISEDAKTLATVIPREFAKNISPTFLGELNAISSKGGNNVAFAGIEQRNNDAQTINSFISKLSSLNPVFKQIEKVTGGEGFRQKDLAQLFLQAIIEARKTDATGSEDPGAIARAARNTNLGTFANLTREGASPLQSFGRLSVSRFGVNQQERTQEIRDRSLLQSLDVLKEAGVGGGRGGLPEDLQKIADEAKRRLGKEGSVTAIESIVTGFLNRPLESLGLTGENGTRNESGIISTAKNLVAGGNIPPEISAQLSALLAVYTEKIAVLPAQGGSRAYAPGGSSFDPRNTLKLGGGALPVSRIPFNPESQIIPNGGVLAPSRPIASKGSSITVDGKAVELTIEEKIEKLTTSVDSLSKSVGGLDREVRLVLDLPEQIVANLSDEDRAAISSILLKTVNMENQIGIINGTPRPPIIQAPRGFQSAIK